MNGEKISCAQCGLKFIKKMKYQKFCCWDCRMSSRVKIPSKEVAKANKKSIDRLFAIIELRDRGKTLAEIGKKYGISRQAVFQIIKNRDNKYIKSKTYDELL